MKIKEFEAESLKDCLHQVRQDLGPEAVILETQKVRKGGVMGWRAHDAVRILAANGITVNEPPAVALPPRPHAAETNSVPYSPVHDAHASRPQDARPKALAAGCFNSRLNTRIGIPDPGSDDKFGRLEQQICELRIGMEALRSSAIVHSLPSPPPLTATRYPAVQAKLLAADVQPELAAGLLESLADFSAWAAPAREYMAVSALRDSMANRVECSGPISVTGGGTKVVALIGPTGVGKTTTIAKLAAHYALVEKCRVGLVTLDTYRIAAVDQLRTYSQIIDLPLRVVHDPSELGAALLELKDRELVLVDTAGRSHKNSIHVDELRALIDSVKIETHLVLSASTKRADINDQIDRFSASAHIDRLLFSKLDETSTYGTLYTLAATRGIPVSYLTTGQRVPEDIELADSIRVTNLVLHDRHEHGA